MKTSGKFSDKHGISALEAVVVIAIFTSAVLVVMNFILQSYQVNRFADEQNEAINHAKKGIDAMVKDLRESLPGENGDYPIKDAQNQSLTFYADVDLDGEVEKVKYFLNGTDLKKSLTEPSGFPPIYNPSDEIITTISQYVQNASTPIFYYYNGDWPGDIVNNPLTTPIDTKQIKLIRVYLKININPATAPKDFILESDVQIRNLKDNL